MFDYPYFKPALSTAITLVVFLLLRYITHNLIKRYATAAHLSGYRTNLVNKYLDIFMIIIVFVVVYAIWGVDSKNLFAVFSTTFTVIGVALFAQWSILSNITSGIILFFTFPFRIGDVIKIHDKDFPIEARIEDIKAFHTILKTSDNELITYPNNLLLQKSVAIVPEKPEESEDKQFFD